MSKKQTLNSIEVLVTLFTFLPLIEARFIAVHISESYIVFIVVWFLLSLYFRLSSKVTFSLSVSTLVFVLLASIVGNGFIATRLAIWFYLFFCEAFLLQFIEHFIDGRKSIVMPSYRRTFQFITTSPLFAFLTVMRFIIYRSKILLTFFVSAWLSLIINQLLGQAKYFYWYFYFDKLRHFITQTLVFEFILAVFLWLLFIRFVQWSIDAKLSLTFYVIAIFMCNLLVYFVTTRNITIQGDIPSIAEVKNVDGFVQLWGHNFRRWPNEVSKVYLNEQPQEVVYWSDVLIVFKPSEQKEHSYIWLISPLEFTSKKYRVNLKE